MRLVRSCFLGFAAVVALTGCISSPTIPESLARQDIFAEQEPLQQKITENGVERQLDLGEALARSVLYNLDNRVQAMERVIAQGNANLESFSMLPNMTLSAGYFHRDREDMSSSRNAVTGLESPATGTSSDKEQVVGSLGQTWSVLDFGVAMVRTQQLRAQEQAALQRQRQSLQNILSETSYAYTKADIAQRTQLAIDAMLEEVDSALEVQATVQKEGVKPRLDVLQVQRNLLSIHNELLALRQGLVISERELNGLVSLPPGMPVTLARQNVKGIPQPISPSAQEFEYLEKAALLMHPELRAADNEVFMHQQEVRRTLFSMLPNLELSNVGSYTSNDFTVHSIYSTLGARVTHNLVNLYKLPTLRGRDKARLELEEKKRLALSLAVITKVHVSLANYNALRDEYAFALKRAEARQALAESMQAQYQAGEIPLYERLLAQLHALEAQLQAELLGAGLENAMGQVYTSIGVDTLLPDVSTDNLSELANSLRKRVETFNNINDNLISMAKSKAVSAQSGI